MKTLTLSPAQIKSLQKKFPNGENILTRVVDGVETKVHLTTSVKEFEAMMLLNELAPLSFYERINLCKAKRTTFTDARDLIRKELHVILPMN